MDAVLHSITDSLKMEQVKSQYANIIFLLIDPISMRSVGKGILLKSKEQYTQLLERAKDKKLYLATCEYTTAEDGKMVLSPMVMDWDSIPDKQYQSDTVKSPKIKQSTYNRDHIHPDKMSKQQPTTDKLFSCPYCNKTMTSLSGRTLHIQSKHPDMKTAEGNNDVE